MNELLASRMSPIELPSPIHKSAKETRQSHDYKTSTKGNPIKTSLRHTTMPTIISTGEPSVGHGTARRGRIGPSAAVKLLLWRRVSALPGRLFPRRKTVDQGVRGLSPKRGNPHGEERESRILCV
ncbi:hypothetical protein BDW42DRAFT_182165 [Aspergillus taichungensis]|uniref:Uncharacterized protein n=1 Tax=Aspergillus taichungensis TaxID=482145 RepID=A0A2J5HCJ1_9EURO|nr:hypothetical protein BDW42DRAFT_182165 [Aspergillus taichungensis]